MKIQVFQAILISSIVLSVRPNESEELGQHMDEVYKAQHVGCFRDSGLRRFQLHTKVRPTLTWEICLHLCANKVTRYAGVQVRTGLCYCGEALNQLSEKIDPQSCLPCIDNQTHYCGGDASVSLYQFHNEDKLVLILATAHGIEMLKAGRMIKLVSQLNVMSVAVHEVNQEIYFTERNKILRLKYVPVLMSYIPPTVVAEVETSLTGLAIDWVNNKLLWSCTERQDIRRAELNGSNTTQIIHNAPNIHGFVYEPYEQSLFFTFTYIKDRLNMYSLSGRTMQDDIAHAYGLTSILKMALDVHFKTLYTIGSFKEDKRNCLAKINYDGTVFTSLVCDNKLSNPSAMDVFNNTVFWINYQNRKYIIYEAKVLAEANMYQINLIHQTTQRLSFVKVYNSDMQTPNIKTLCDTCSHQCKVITFSAVECSCPPDMLLGTDDKTCTVPVNENSSQSYEQFSDTTYYTTLETTEDSTSTDIEISTYATTTDDLSLSTPSVEEYAEHKSPSTTSFDVTPSLPDSQHSSFITNTHLSLLICVSTLITVGLLISVLYTIVRVKRLQNKLQHRDNVLTELEAFENFL